MRPAGFLLIWAFATSAQIPPAVYLDLYSTLQQHLMTFDATVTSQWNGSKPPVDFCAELRTPGAARVLQSLGVSPTALVEAEIQSLQAMGVSAVSLGISFPSLYQPFFIYNGDPGDYQKYLTFYQQVAADIRAAGMRMVVHTEPLYTGVLTENSGMNVAPYYKTLTTSDYIAARTHQILTIAQIQPDYLVVAGEPDNEAVMTGQPFLATAAGFAAMVDTFLTQLDDAGFTGTYVGAGIGTWLSGGSAFIKSLAANPRLNFIDLNVFSINAGLLDTTTALIDQAAATGKPVTISSAWLEKRLDSEYPAPNIAADPNIFGRDPFSFWAPLDQQFLTELVKLAWWKKLALVSAHWSDYFHTYLPYNAVNAALLYNPLRNDVIQAFSTAVQNNQYTSSGLAWQSIIQTPVVLPALVSGCQRASGTRGSQLHRQPFWNQPGYLDRERVDPPAYHTRRNQSRVHRCFWRSAAQPASLYFVSPEQVNAVVPAQLVPGPVAFQIGNSSGTATLSAVAPSLFSASNSGRGPAAALVSVLHADGTSSVESAATCTASICTNYLIDLSSATDQAFLELFGTGIRGRNSLSDVRVSVGGVLVAPSYAGAQPQYPGMDQVNIPLPKSLAGRGTLNIDLFVAGQRANIVTISTK